VIAVCAPTAVLSDILLTADDLGMLSDDKNVFINVDLFSTYSKLIRPWISESASSEEIEKTKRAFEFWISVDNIYHC
jgi:hypothetical protein